MDRFITRSGPSSSKRKQHEDFLDIEDLGSPAPVAAATKPAPTKKQKTKQVPDPVSGKNPSATAPKRRKDPTRVFAIPGQRPNALFKIFNHTRVFLISINEGLIKNYEISKDKGLWASTIDRNGNSKLVAAYQQVKKANETHQYDPPMEMALLFTSIPGKDPKHRKIHGLAVVTGDCVKGLRVEWQGDRNKYGDCFPVRWKILPMPFPPFAPLALLRLWDATEIIDRHVLIQCVDLAEGVVDGEQVDRGQVLLDRTEEMSRPLALEEERPNLDQESVVFPSNIGGVDPSSIPSEEAAADVGLCDLDAFIPPIAPREYWDASQNDLHFCVYDVDYVELRAIREPFAGKTMDVVRGNVVPVIRLFGVTREGYQVGALIRGFLPYIYIRIPTEFRNRMIFPPGTNYSREKLDNDPKARFEVANAARQQKLCSVFKNVLDQALAQKLTVSEKKNYEVGSLVFRVEMVRRESIDGYEKYLDWFLKITFCSPKLVVRAREILRNGYKWLGTGFSDDQCQPTNHAVFEANIPFAMRFMVDRDLYGVSWVTLKREKYFHWKKEDEKETFCDIEVIAHYEDMQAHLPDDPNWSDAPPVRKLTFDIECAGKDGRFPLPYETDTSKKDGAMIPGSGDPVICIAARLTQEGKTSQERIIGDIIFTWGKCNETRVAKVMSYYQNSNCKATPRNIAAKLNRHGDQYARNGCCRLDNGDFVYWTREDERDMLRQFRDFVVKLARPQVLCGYNVTGFDLPYLIERAQSLGLGAEFDIIGLGKRDRTFVKTRIFSSKAYGNREMKEFNIAGRLVLDCMTVIMRDFKYRSYSLNSVAEQLLKDKDGNAAERKADVPHTMIGPLWSDTNETRKKVAEYCWKDVDITEKLEQRLIMFIDKMELARATGVPFSYIITRGQQIKVMSLVLRKAKLERRIVFTREHEEVVESDKYKGATVIEPKPGFYDEPVATLDFSSLYPSIMRWKNMSYCTRITVGDLERFPFQPSDLYITPTETGDVMFVKEHIKKGILPVILAELTDKRNQAKSLMKKHDGTWLAKIYDKRQNALKVTSNSVYGFTGAEATGMLPCSDIAKAVTSTGRIGIELTARMVETPYSEIPREENESDEAYLARSKKIRSEYPLKKLDGETDEAHAKRIQESVEIIYGDTDSVMVRMKTIKDAKGAIELGTLYADWITKYFFKKPMAILFEKIYFPYLLIAKKRYAGLYWTKPDKPDKKDTKGMESVRRDNCPLVQETVDTMIKTILTERDVMKMVKVIIDRVESVSNNTIDLSRLIISKSLSKPPEDYHPTPPQAQVALKMRARNPHTAPKMGDRVPYIVTAYGGKKEKTSKKAEHPIEVLKHNIPYDKTYYIDRQLRKPCERILEPLLPGITNHIFSNVSQTIYIPEKTDAFSARSAAEKDFVAVQPKTHETIYSKGLGGAQKTRKINKNKVLPIQPGQINIFGELLHSQQKKITEARPGCAKLSVTHSIHMEDASKEKNSIGVYAKVIPTCIICNIQMRQHIDKELSDAPLACDECLKKESTAQTIAERREETAKKLEERLQLTRKLWDTCVRCQKVESEGDLRECASFECPNFFQRTTSKMELIKVQIRLERFDKSIPTGSIPTEAMNE